VRLAVRRSRRRRAAGAAGAAVLAAGLVTGVTLAADGRYDATPQPADRSDVTPPPLPTPPPRELGADADPFFLAGRTAGSLGDDEPWLRGLRQRAVAEGKAPGESAVRVLWAHDHDGVRHALTLAELRERDWGIVRWRGPAGAEPGRLAAVAAEGVPMADPGARPTMVPTMFPVRTEGNAGPGLLVVVGEDLRAVEVSAGADYDTTGRRSDRWVPLEPDAGVWVGEASETMLDTMHVRVAPASDGRWRPPYSDSDAPGVAAPPAGLADVAAAGADADVLACAGGSFVQGGGGFPAGSTAVLGATPTLDGEWLGLVVARAPAGGHLVGVCRTGTPDPGAEAAATQTDGFVVPAPRGGAGALLAAVPCRRAAEGLTAVCVIAPEGAVEVEVAGVTREVRDRVAVVPLPAGTSEDGIRAVARGPGGEVLGTAEPAADEAETRFEGFHIAGGIGG
jgi:hypothetical protein